MTTPHPLKLELPQSNYGSGMIMKPEIDFDQILPHLEKQSNVSISAPDGVIITTTGSITLKGDNTLTATHLTAKTPVHTILIPAMVNLTDPIIIQSTSNLPIQAESILIIAEAGAKADIIQIEESEQQAQFKSQIIELQVHPQARLRYSTLINNNNNDHMRSYSTKHATVYANASIEWVEVRMGGSFSRSETISVLEEQGAVAKCWNIYYGTKSEQFDIASSSVHNAAHTTSELRAKAVLQDTAKAMYRGNINISKNASQSVSQQKSETILLGDQAKCNALPILQVENDDVICSHGAAMGQVSDQDLFYLCSRGFDEKAATQLLVESFLQVGIDRIPSSEYQQRCRSWLSQRLRV